ncbi:MAG: DNA translocase FtsK 4TM domain-containing protein [Gemmatimonadaceae bacterium]|nr:DNA translocase FtsK 4TM domain-containing protein [Gemmatimonadaceae bacterium]
MNAGVRREIAGIAFILLAVFLAGALAFQRLDPYTSCAGARGVFGPVGGCLKWTLQSLLGAPAAWLVTLLPLAHGLRLMRDARPIEGRRWLTFIGGSAVLLPIFIGMASVAAREPGAWAGLWGGFAATYTQRAFGTAGAWIVWLLLASALMAWTLRWNPVRMIIGSGAARVRSVQPTLASILAPPPEEMPAVEGFVATATAANAPSASANEEQKDDLALQRKKRERRAREKDAPMSDADGPPSSAGVAATPTGPPPVPDEHALEHVVPSSELLTPPPAEEHELGRRELDAMGQKLMDALRTFKVDGTLVGRTTGPVVTQFEVEPAPGVKVRQFANLANDLALAMRSPSIRVVAPIPGRGAVGVEVPNPTPQLVAFRELIDAPQFRSARMALPIALGKDLEGHAVVADLAKMPHLLIAGATGSGKSVCVNTIITSLVYRHTPETLKFLMVDPKMVELSVYNALPHLLHKVITDNRDAAYVLKWAVQEMQRRYELLAANGSRNIQEFNKRVEDGSPLQHRRSADVAFERREYTDGLIPYVVLVIDELADLMMTVQGEVETPLAMLAQKARAIGIHIILATQRPSVNVITGLIKANFPSRIAFRVASQIDSRTIIDGMGAESLLGNGDMLFIPPGKSEPQRLQGAYIPGEDTERLVQWFQARKEARQAALASKGMPDAELIAPDIIAEMKALEALDREDDAEEGAELSNEKRDPLFLKAAETCIQHQLGSTSLLQRRLGVGYGRAARIIDQLHAAGVLGPANGSKPREILMGLDDLGRIADRRIDD